MHLLLLEVSHIVRRGAWAEFFMVLSRHGRTGVFLHGFLSLWFGSVVVGFSRVWAGAGEVKAAKFGITTSVSTRDKLKSFDTTSRGYYAAKNDMAGTLQRGA